MLLSKQGHAVLWGRRGMRRGNMARHVVIQARPCGGQGNKACGKATRHAARHMARQQGTRQGNRACGKATRHAARHVTRQQAKMARQQGTRQAGNACGKARGKASGSLYPPIIALGRKTQVT